MLIFRLQIVFKACLVCSNVNHEVIFFLKFFSFMLDVYHINIFKHGRKHNQELDGSFNS